MTRITNLRIIIKSIVIIAINIVGNLVRAPAAGHQQTEQQQPTEVQSLPHRLQPYSQEHNLSKNAARSNK